MNRFHAASTSSAKAAAKRLKARLDELGTVASLPSCQNTVAELRGFSHFHELEKRAGKERPSPFDDDCAEDERLRRRTRQVEVLRSKYPDLRDPEALLDLVRPTAGARAVAAGRGELPDIGFSGGWFRVHSYAEEGAAVVLVSEWPAPGEKAHTFVIRAGDGRLAIGQTEGIAHEPADLANLPKPRFVVVEDHVWERLGYGPGIYGGKAMDGRFRPDEANGVLLEARCLLEARLDAPLFRSLAGACLTARLTEIYNTVQVQGPLGRGLRDFCIKYPALVRSAFAVHDRRGSEPFVPPSGTADEIALAVLSAGIGARDARIALGRMGYLRWAPSYERRFMDVAGPLAHLPNETVPKTCEEASEFAVCCGMLRQALPEWLPGRPTELARLLVTISHRLPWRSWCDARHSLDAMANSAHDRLRHDDPVDLGDDDEGPAELLTRCARYAIQDFCGRVVAPAMNRAGHRFEYGDRLAQGVAAASARLVLDGTSAQEVLWLGELWLRLPDDRPEGADALEAYRRLMAPCHRELDERGIVAFAESCLSRPSDAS